MAEKKGKGKITIRGGSTPDYKIVVVQPGGTKETIVDWDLLEYEDIINQSRRFKIVIGKANENDYDKFNAYYYTGGVETGVVYIYRKGVLELKGHIEDPIYDKLGRLVLTGPGEEVKIQWKATEEGKTYSSTGLDTLVANMIGDISGIDMGVYNQVSADGPVENLDVGGMTYLDGLIHAIVEIGNNEWYMNYSDSGNSSFNNIQYRGSATSIGTLVEGIDIINIQRSKKTSRLFNQVHAVGKSEGGALIKITRDGADAVPGYLVTPYGRREPSSPLVNKRITNEADLTKFADNFLKQHMYPVEEIQFDAVDINYSHNVGDLVSIRGQKRLADTGDYFKRDLRIISQTRIISKDSERLILKVTKEGLNTLPSDTNARFKRLQDQIVSHQVVEQGDIVPLTYVHSGKTSSTKWADMTFILPDWITTSDQIKSAKLTVHRLPIYYDTPSATGSGNAAVSDSGHANHGVSGATTSHTEIIDQGYDSFNNVALSSGWNTDELSETFSGTIGFLECNVYIKTDFSTATDINIGIKLHGGGKEIYYQKIVPGTSISNHLIEHTFRIPFFQTINSTMYVDVYTDYAGQYDGSIRLYSQVMAHSHAQGTLTDGTGTAAVSDSGHTNPITRGMNTVSETSSSFGFDCNGNTGGAGSLDVGDTSSELNMINHLNDPSSSRTNNMKVRVYSGYAALMYVLTIKAYRPN